MCRTLRAGPTRERAGSQASPKRTWNAEPQWLGRVGHGRLFYRESQPDLRQQAGHSDGERAVQGTTAGALMAAAAEAFRDFGDVQLPLAAQTDPIAPVGRLAEKHRDLDLPDGERVVHQPFAVFILGLAALHLLPGHPDPGQRPLAVQVGERGPE